MRKTLMLGLFVLLLAASGGLVIQNSRLRAQIVNQSQREVADVVAAMADIEVNLAKLLLASGAQQSVSLLGETAILAQHVESGLSRLPIGAETTSEAMKFAGQMGQYSLTLAEEISGGRVLTGDDEQQLAGMMTACRALGEQIAGEKLDFSSAKKMGDSWGESTIEYPSLIFDGPFSDGRTQGVPKGLTGERVTREQARQQAARYAGVEPEQVHDAADSGGVMEAFGFTADTRDGRLSVQVTGQGGHLLWMMPEQALFAETMDVDECLRRAKAYLADAGFGEMEPCFVQQYDGMVVANFAAVQEGVLLYPDQVKVQVSRDTGDVVGAECSMYMMNHTARTDLTPRVKEEEARQMLSDKLVVDSARLCIIPEESGERLCWGFAGTFGGAKYWMFIDAKTGEAAEILRVVETPDGEAAV